MGVAGADWFEKTTEEKKARCAELGVEVSPQMVDYEVTQHVFEKLVEEKSFDPLYVTHCPKELVPLAKQNKADSSVVDVYELVINGVEISPGYSELNDPMVQRERLEQGAPGALGVAVLGFADQSRDGRGRGGGLKPVALLGARIVLAERCDDPDDLLSESDRQRVADALRRGRGPARHHGGGVIEQLVGGCAVDGRRWPDDQGPEGR